MGKHPGKQWGNIRKTKPNKTILNHNRHSVRNPLNLPFLLAPPPFCGGPLSPSS